MSNIFSWNYLGRRNIGNIINNIPFLRHSSQTSLLLHYSMFVYIMIYDLLFG
jgi:hypothetical protein